MDRVDDKAKLDNSYVLLHLDEKFSHWNSHERMELRNMIHKFEHCSRINQTKP